MRRPCVRSADFSVKYTNHHEVVIRSRVVFTPGGALPSIPLSFSLATIVDSQSNQCSVTGD